MMSLDTYNGFKDYIGDKIEEYYTGDDFTPESFFHYAVIFELGRIAHNLEQLSQEGITCYDP